MAIFHSKLLVYRRVSSKEEQLLADALRLVHSAVAPQKVRDEVQQLLHEAGTRSRLRKGRGGFLGVF